MKVRQPTKDITFTTHQHEEDLLTLVEKLSSDLRILANAEGGYFSNADAAKRLNISTDKLDELRKDNQIIGLPVGQTFIYPQWQFKQVFWIGKVFLKGYEIIPGLDRVLAEFPSKSQWMRAGFMLDSSVALDFVNPLAALRAGKVAQVVSSVKNIGEQGAG
jgi:hypothetical protein